MPLIRKNKMLNALVFALVILTGILLSSQVQVPSTKAENTPTLQDIRNSVAHSQDGSIDFDKTASVPNDVMIMNNSELEKAIKKAKFEYGVVPNDRNKERLDALKKERWARMIHLQMTTGTTATSLPTDSEGNEDDSFRKPSSFKSDGLQNNFLSDSDAFGMCDEDTSDYCNLQTQKDFTLGGGSEMQRVKEEQKQQFQEDLAEHNAFGSGGLITNASFSAQCQVVGGPGANTLQVNGSTFCTQNAVGVNAGTANFSCTPGSTVTISSTCTATTCAAFATAATNLTCPFTPPSFLGGPFDGAGGYGTGAISINCTCQ